MLSYHLQGLVRRRCRMEDMRVQSAASCFHRENTAPKAGHDWYHKRLCAKTAKHWSVLWINCVKSLDMTLSLGLSLLTPRYTT